MRSALFKLMRLQFRGWLRRQFTGGSTRRLVFGVLGTIMFLLWISGVVIGTAIQKSRPAEDILATLPLYLTAFALLPIVLGSDDRAIAFSPAEIDFLFPGPFTRRELVLYKMFKLLLSSVAGGIFFGFVLRRLAASLPVSIAGAILTMAFVNTFTTFVALVRDTVQERFYAFFRRGATLLLILAAAAVIWLVNRSSLPTVDEIKHLASSGPLWIALSPARVFAHVFAADSLAEAGPWMAACSGMILLALVLVLAMDQGYMEAALIASQRRQARIAGMAKGVMLPTGKPVRSYALPRVAAFGPAGAIAKRQLITALRTSRGWILMFVIAGAYGYAVSRMVGSQHNSAGAAGLVPGLVMLVLMLPQMLRFDFRGDLDHLELLKTLPISAVAIVLAELAVPSSVLTLLGWVIAGGVAGFAGMSIQSLMMAALAVPPACLLVIALENFVFLVLPSRLIAPGQAGMVFSGRRVLMMLARFGLITVGGGLTGLVGLATWTLTASAAATYAACWCALLVILAATVSAVTWAYSRFDISVDMPT